MENETLGLLRTTQTTMKASIKRIALTTKSEDVEYQVVILTGDMSSEQLNTLHRLWKQGHTLDVTVSYTDPQLGLRGAS